MACDTAIVLHFGMGGVRTRILENQASGLGRRSDAIMDTAVQGEYRFPKLYFFVSENSLIHQITVLCL